MPRLKNALPKYRKHKASGQAVVTIGGTDHYLGKYGTVESRQKYDRLCREWVSSGRMAVKVDRSSPTISELCLLYLKHCEVYYTKNGKQTDEVACVKAVLKQLRSLYGRVLAHEFGPLALVALREALISRGNSRGYVNKQTNRVKRMFTWAVAQELVRPEVGMALRAVSGLREGRTNAVDHPPVLPVDDKVVEDTLPFLTSHVAAMVQVQRLAGMRPEDVCQMQPDELDRSNDIWLYLPPSHKMSHKGRERVVFIGPKAQQVLTPFLFGDVPCFKNRDGNPFTTRVFRDAIHRGVERANRERRKQGVPELPRWNPNQLRHSAGTEARREFGIEGAQLRLGHARADVTEVYAERDAVKAAEIARRLG